MGIKGLNTIIKNKFSKCISYINIQELNNTKIAIDANLWLYSTLATARKNYIKNLNLSIEDINEEEITKKWLIISFNFLSQLLFYKIVPILIFDGKHDEQKSGTQSKRIDQRNKIKDKIEELREIFNKNKDDILLRDDSLLKKALSNYVFLTKDNLTIFKEIATNIGYCCITAEAEGEKLCSDLCIEKKVDYVFSKDSDMLALTCPLIITEFNFNSIKVININVLIEEMGFNKETFQDFCILLGCDWNHNIKKCGPVQSLKLINKYKNINNIPLDKECLNYEFCKKQFTFKNTDIDEEKLIFDYNKFSEYRKYLISNNHLYLINCFCF